MASEREDRTEAATPRRLQRAREQGQFPLSREVPLLTGLGGAALALMLFAAPAAQQAAQRLSGFFADAHRIDLSDGGGTAIRDAMGAGLRLAGPFIAATLVCGVTSVLLQTGGALHPGALMPNLARLNPLGGFKRVFGWDGLVESGKSLVKIAVLAAAGWLTLSGRLPVLARAPLAETQTLPAEATRLVFRALLVALSVQAVITAADVVWTRLRHARNLRMSREEIREELKDTDGDPRVKGRLRQIRMQRARKRMLAAVPKATVVITNPTHFSVALAYDRATSSAPRLVAKGVDSMAARIREIAVANRVPLVANPPLARALYRVELDAEIPPEHYQAVAEIVAYVWGLGRRARGAAG